MIKKRDERAAFDFYPTAPEAVHALLEHEHLCFPVWEPAAGDGAMVRAIKSSAEFRDNQGPVFASDLQIEDWVFGTRGLDFLQVSRPPPLQGKSIGTIITNPPHSEAERFVRHAIALKPRRVMMLLRLGFLEGNGRAALFEELPPAKVYVLSRRLPFKKYGVWSKSGGQFAHAWFVWNPLRNFKAAPELHWLSVPEYSIPEGK